MDSPYKFADAENGGFLVYDARRTSVIPVTLQIGPGKKINEIGVICHTFDYGECLKIVSALNMCVRMAQGTTNPALDIDMISVRDRVRPEVVRTRKERA